MKDQLYINDQEIQLDPNTKVALTSQLNDLSDASTHQSNFSNTLKAPMTNSNLGALGNSDQVQSETLIPYRKNKLRLIKDGVEVMPSGFAVVDQTEKAFSIIAYSGNLDFFSSIEGKNIRDLDLSSMDHDFNFADIIAARANDYTDGWKYPIIDYGQLDTGSRNVDPSKLRLCVFTAFIFKKIISEAGFTYDGDIFSSEKFNKLLMTCENDNKGQYYDEGKCIQIGPWVSQPSIPIQGDGQITIKANEIWTFDLSIQFVVGGWTNGVSFLSIGSLQSTYGPTFNAAAYSHLDADGAGTFTKTITISYPYGPSPVDVIDSIFANFANCFFQVKFGELKGYKNGATDPTFKVHIPQNTGITAGGTDAFESFGFDYVNQYSYASINVAKTLPDMSQKDFIKGIASIFHLMFKTDQVSKKISFKRFQDITEDLAGAIDMTDKMQMDSHTLSFNVGRYAKKNYCKFTEDSNDKDKPEGYGNGTVTVDDETLGDESTMLTLPFSSSVMKTRLIGLFVPSVKRIDADDAYTIDTVPRLLIDATDTIADDPISFDDSGSVDAFTSPSSLDTNDDIPLCYFILGDKPFSAGFNDSVLEDNFSGLTRVLNKSKVMQVLMKISSVDFLNIDHFRLIYLHQFASYFYLPKVSNFTGEGLTKYNIIRVGQRKQGMLGLVQRCTNSSSEGYGQMDRIGGGGKYVLTKMLIDGIDYAHNQQIIVTSIVTGPGTDGVAYQTNVSDWINGILPVGYKMLNNGRVWDYPVDGQFEIEIQYDDGVFVGNTYRYTNAGFFIPDQPDSPFAVYSCEILR